MRPPSRLSAQSLFASGSGFYLSNAILSWALYWFVFVHALLAATNRETAFKDGLAFDIEAFGDEQVYYAEFMLQLGMIYMLPLFFGRWSEQGLWRAIKEFVTQFCSAKPLFGLFEMRTSMYYLDRGIRLGQAEYIATGRTYATMNSNFTNLYSLYARSHFCFAMEILSMSFVYALFTRQAGYLLLFMWPAWLYCLSLLFSPWLFDPRSFRGLSVREHFYEFAMWLDDKDGVTATMARFSTWSKWHAHHMAALRSRSLGERLLLLLGRDLLPKVALFFACCAALDVDEYLPPESVVTTMVVTAAGANGSAANVTASSEVVGTTVALARPHFRALILATCAGYFVLVCLPLYALTDHRFVRRGVLPASRWWHIAFSWAARAGAIAGHVALCFWSFARYLGPLGTSWEFKEAAIVNGNGATLWYIPALKTALIMLMVGVLLQSFVAQLLGLLRPPHEGQTRGRPVRTQLLHYSDFFFRELDWWIGTMLYICLLLLTLLPISYVHSKMLFNRAFANTLQQVSNRRQLMAELYSLLTLRASSLYQLALLCLKRSINFCAWLICGYARARPPAQRAPHTAPPPAPRLGG